MKPLLGNAINSNQMNRQLKKTFIVMATLSIICCATSSFATTYRIISDGSWRSYNQIQTGWNLLGYDDSSWRYAVEYYGNYFNYKFWNIAIPIWDWPGPGTPTGMNGPLRAYFRKEIDLDGPVTSAFVTFSADDSAAIYVNGNLIRHASSGINISIPTELFQPGPNMLAVYANDGTVGRVYERQKEIIGFYFDIETASCISITDFSGTDTTINPLPLSGQFIDLTASVVTDYPEEVSWTLGIDGHVIDEGYGSDVAAEWNGKDPDGEIVPGVYDLTLEASGVESGCFVYKTISVSLDWDDNCKLQVTFLPVE